MKEKQFLSKLLGLPMLLINNLKQLIIVPLHLNLHLPKNGLPPRLPLTNLPSKAHASPLPHNLIEARPHPLHTPGLNGIQQLQQVDLPVSLLELLKHLPIFESKATGCAGLGFGGRRDWQGFGGEQGRRLLREFVLESNLLTLTHGCFAWLILYCYIGIEVLRVSFAHLGLFCGLIDPQWLSIYSSIPVPFVILTIFGIVPTIHISQSSTNHSSRRRLNCWIHRRVIHYSRNLIREASR